MLFMRTLVALIVLLGLVAGQAPPQFFRIGRTPSPDIPVGGTLFLPSETSVNLDPNILAGNVQIHVAGVNLPAIGSWTLGRATPTAGNPQQCTPFPLPPVGGNGVGFNEVGYQIAPAVAAVPASPNVQAFNLPTQLGAQGRERWNSQKLEIANVPVELCFALTNQAGAPTPNGWFVSGFKIAVAWDCISGDPQADCSQYQPLTLGSPGYEALTPRNMLTLKAQTQCCKAAGGLRVGVCINPNAQQCCGGQPINGQTQVCCNPLQQRVTPVGVRCACSGTPTGTFRINDVFGRVFTAQDAVCPTGTRCCLPSKYPELSQTFARGECYNPQQERCCNTGLVYDPGTQQCCTINGLQSADVPCPCSNDTHCNGGQVEFPNTNQRCCRQTDPIPRETEFCTIYANGPLLGQRPPANAPFGTGDASRQRCLGHCIDTRYQICCNGVACVQEYERCCNNTCCNKFSATCDFGEQTGTPGNPWNNNNFRVLFMHCSTIEQLNPPRAVLIFILPLFLMLLTLLSLAVAIVFANKATTRSYSGLEIGIILVAVVAAIFALSLYFSPMWKYGLWVVIVCILSFLAAAARVFAFNAVVVVLQLIAILYIFDPMHASRYLNLSIYRDPNTGAPLPCTYGLFHTTQCMADNGSRNCRSYYDYFSYDPLLRDTDRFENPEVQAWGYCDRHWFTTLLIFEVIMMVLLVVLFLLTLLGLLLRFRPLLPEPVALEIVKEQPDYFPQYPVGPPAYVM